ATLKVHSGSRTVFSSGDKDTKYITLENISTDTVNWSLNIIGRKQSGYFQVRLDDTSKWTTIENSSSSLKQLLTGTLEAGKNQKIHVQLHRSYKTDYHNFENYIGVFFRDEDNPNKHISQLLHVRAPELEFKRNITTTRNGSKVINLTSRTKHMKIPIENSAYPCYNYESGILLQKVKCGELDWMILPAPGKNYEKWFYTVRRVDPTLPRRGLLEHNVLQVGIDSKHVPKTRMTTRIRVVSNELDDSKGGDIYTYNHPPIKIKQENDDGTFYERTKIVPWRTGKVHDITIIFTP
ncbi:MAG: hypothetical protein OYH77_07590, partial [Pseudomonadota bacterium]|nr:hypothetical protein [Pseudomonadota bacterium]